MSLLEYRVNIPRSNISTGGRYVNIPRWPRLANSSALKIFHASTAQTPITSVNSFTAAADFLSAASSSGGQRDLNNLFDAARAELHRHAHEQIADPVFALQEHRARHDLLLVLENDLDHFRRGGAGRIPRARAHEFRDLGAAVGGALADRRDSIGCSYPDSRAGGCPRSSSSAAAAPSCRRGRRARTRGCSPPTRRFPWR